MVYVLEDFRAGVIEGVFSDPGTAKQAAQAAENERSNPVQLSWKKYQDEPEDWRSSGGYGVSAWEVQL